MSTPVVILGGGGHARVIADALETAGYSVGAVIDPAPLDWPAERGAAQYRNEDECLVEDRWRNAPMVLGVARNPDNDIFLRLFERIQARGVNPVSVLHSAACISSRAQLKEGVQILAGAVVQSGAILEDSAVVNTRAVVEHDVNVGCTSHIAPGAILLGGVVVECGVFVGAGAVVRQNTRIGKGAIIGMGSTILQDVPPGMTVYGVWNSKRT